MKFYDLQKIIKEPYFFGSDLRLRNFKIYPYQFSNWIKSERLSRIKRGLYYFTERKQEIKPEGVAFLIYEPSYISLESVLSYYNFIPEKVFAITSVTTKQTRKFSNDFGNFIYRKISPKLFFGYNIIQSKNGKYLFADPEKALLDYLYLNSGQINNLDDVKEIRLNYQEIKDKINWQKINRYLKVFNVKKLGKIIKLLKRSPIR